MDWEAGKSTIDKGHSTQKCPLKSGKRRRELSNLGERRVKRLCLESLKTEFGSYDTCDEVEDNKIQQEVSSSSPTMLNSMLPNIRLDDDVDMHDSRLPLENLLHGFQIFVINLSGKTLTFTIQKSTKVFGLKSMINQREGLPVEGQRLLFGGKELRDELFLRDYNINKESTLHLVWRLPGGQAGLRYNFFN